MSKNFVHLHNHTEYSLLDGANRVSDLVKYAASMDMGSIAISDHGVMFGVMEFYLEAKKAGIKPILGVEAYVAANGIGSRESRADRENFHLLLLAKNETGYKNLCRLSSYAALKGFYGKPRVDHNLLAQFSEGVIATSACLGSEICQALLAGNPEEANRIAGKYVEIFGRENFFIELQDHGLPEQHQIFEPLLKIARDLRLDTIATNDAHYLCKGDAKPHDVLLCIQTGELVNNTNRMKFATDEFYIKSQEEMAALFKELPEALENTAKIAEMCNVSLDKATAPMPEANIPAGMSSYEFLRQQAFAGLKSRATRADSKLERLEYELGIIEQTGFSDYFLLVGEFAAETRNRGIHYGVRGSAAGSLVSYAIGITDVDPVDYDLTFERFLNPERISMPDIDMDFEDARRDEIIKWVSNRFGEDHVAQIITFGTMAAKAAIKDCGRVLGYSPQETDSISKLIPGVPGMTLEHAYKDVADFRARINSDARLKELFDTAKSVEGMSRNAGVHAAGIVISRDPLADYIPLYRGNEGQPVTAYPMGILEKIGMLKMDFLGLSNLTVVAKALELIERNQGVKLDVKNLPEEDTSTWEALSRGETTGVFQLESGGMTRWLTQLKPNNIRELSAMIALFRPGPMGEIPNYIDFKFGRRKAEYLDERMRPILDETFGVIVYQDQVLKLVQALAGFSLGKADILRRAMGKKDAKAMKEMKVEFLTGTAEHGISQSSAEKVWELLVPFAGYAFNKAHAVCYAILSFQTAYLKANYPVEYMAALLASYRTKEDRVVAFIEECRRLKIPVLPPDVNRSQADFSIEKNAKGVAAIRFGLGAIKGVGDGVVATIIQNRTTDGEFRHLYEFCERIKEAGLNKTASEALIKSGALDSIDANRSRSLQFVEAALMFADNQLKNKNAGQDSLFGESAEDAGTTSYPVLPDVEQMRRAEKLALEREVMGVYVSDHPLRGMERVLAGLAGHTCAEALEMEEGQQVKLAGIVSSLRNIVTKAGKRMMNINLEDFSGAISGIVFPAVHERLRDTLVKDSIVVVHGELMVNERGGEKQVELRVTDAKPLDPNLDLGLSADQLAPGSVVIKMRKGTEKNLQALKDLINENKGDYEAFIEVQTQPIPATIPLGVMITSSEVIIKEIQRLTGLAPLVLAREPN